MRPALPIKNKHTKSKMKKQLSVIAGLALYSGVSLFGQNIIPCNTNEMMQGALNADPVLKQKFELEQSMFELEYQKNMQQLTSGAQQKTAVPVYTVPVVFHILHQNGPENITDQQCINALAQVNKDYRKLGSDIASIHPSFAPLYVDAEIQFVLAHKDPNGNCTTGIVHHYDANTNWIQPGFGTCPSAQYAYSGTQAGRWNPTKYLNIYIVKSICPQGGCTGGGTIVGYTYLPGSNPCSGSNNASDAIVYDYRFLSGTQARSLSHEIGHWFNLTHTFGNTNNPGTGTCGAGGNSDGVSDTPTTLGYFSTCPGGNTGPFTGCSNPENIENFMDYSSCPRMFTQGQVTKMRTAIVSSTGGRNNLWTAANLTATDAGGTAPCAPIADFYASKVVICAGQSTVFNDASYNGTVSSRSWSFQGGSPATSSASAPTVTYSAPGTYQVTYTVTNASGNDVETKTTYIDVRNGTGTRTAPYTESFESNIPADWTVVNNNGGSVTWAQASVGANSTSKSVYINSISGNPAGHIDVLETPILNLSNITGLTMSYYYAYARKTATQADTFKLQYSLDCGGTWTNLPSLTTAAMATNSGGTTSSPYTPAASDWKQYSIPSVLLGSLNGKPSVKLRFYFRNDVSVANANNIYLDEINLSGIVGINELENLIGLNIYPNPTNASSTVEFNLPDQSGAVTIRVTDLLGRSLETGRIEAGSGHVTYTVNQGATLGQGIYLVSIELDGKRITKKLIIH